MVVAVAVAVAVAVVGGGGGGGGGGGAHRYNGCPKIRNQWPVTNGFSTGL